MIKYKREFPLGSGYYHEETISEDKVIKELYNTLGHTTLEAVIENNRIDIVSETKYIIWSYIFDDGEEFGKFFKKLVRVLSGRPEGPYGPYIPYSEG